MEEELLERIFQKIVDKHFCDDDGQVLREALSTYVDKYFCDDYERQNLIEKNYYINIIKGEVDL